MIAGDKKKQGGDSSITWQEESGLIGFLSTINEEVKRFDRTFDLGVRMLAGQPESIDGSTELLRHIGFVVLRQNSVLIGRDYCLYCLLKGRALHGYIGIYSGGAITTVKELGPVTDYDQAQEGLLGWLRDLLRASFEKI